MSDVFVQFERLVWRLRAPSPVFPNFEQQSNQVPCVKKVHSCWHPITPDRRPLRRGFPPLYTDECFSSGPFLAPRPPDAIRPGGPFCPALVSSRLVRRREKRSSGWHSRLRRLVHDGERSGGFPHLQYSRVVRLRRISSIVEWWGVGHVEGDL